MQISLALTALTMGLVGGPHCVAMCGAACAGIGKAASPHSNRAIGLFQAGRVIGYSLLGALAAASMQGLGWLTVQSAALRPVWTLFHIAAILMGLLLLIQARQPLWLDTAARSVWARARSWSGSSAGAPLVLGVMWSLLPCGLLYSALLVAAMSGGIADGAAVMALFSLGTSVTLSFGPWLLLRLLGEAKNGSGRWGIRLAGAALAASSGWALWMGLVHDQAPWCLAPV